MFLLCKQHRYWVAVPLFTVFIWSSTLLSMLLTWVITGRPKYVPTQVAVITYISDVGSSYLKPLFIVACCITGPGLVLSLILERHLRPQGRLSPEQQSLERVFGQLSIVGAVITMFALALLSGFDVLRHRTEHLIFLFVFIVGVSVSFIFTVLEFRLLAHSYPEIERLKTSYCAKAVIGLTVIILSIVLGFTYFNAPTVGAVIEWTIAFGFTLYLLTFAYDVWMVKENESGTMKEWKVIRSLKDRALTGSSTTLVAIPA